MSNNVIKSLALVAGMAGMAAMGEARGGCFKASPPDIRDVSLGDVNISVGRDMPLGTEVYRMDVRISGAWSCRDGDVFFENYTLPVTPLPLANWSGSPHGGKVYETGVKGLGVAMLHSNKRSVVPVRDGPFTCRKGSNCNYFNVGYEYSFIKIGDVSAGTVEGAALPVWEMNVESDTPVLVARGSAVGSVNVVTGTCTTPDVNVPMGKQKTSEFSGIGSATPWRSFNIELLNCPPFEGFYSSQGLVNGNGVIGGFEKRKFNLLYYRLNAVDGADPYGTGVIRLSPSATDVIASGVGIQIANENETPLPLNNILFSGIFLQAISGGSYSVPLKARYIQTKNTVTPGVANGAATFTLEYR